MFLEIFLLASLLFLAFILFLRAPAVTGTIGSGKSTLVYIVQELLPGIVIIDADKIARELLEPGQPAYYAVIEHFGASVVSNGAIDRKKLSAIVFSDPQKRSLLNRLTHRRVFFEIFRQLLRAKISGKKVLVDVPLLFESPRWVRGLFGPKILVFCDEGKKISRVMRRDDVDEASVLARLRNQIPDAQKIPLADILVENNGDLQTLRSEISRRVIASL